MNDRYILIRDQELDELYEMIDLLSSATKELLESRKLYVDMSDEPPPSLQRYYTKQSSVREPDNVTDIF